MKNLRINFLFFSIFLFALIILARLYELQISKGDFYKALASGLVFETKEEKERGEIFLKGGEALATNRDFYFVFAIPEKIKDLEDTAEKLSQFLGIEKEKILEKIGEKKSYQIIKKELSKEEIDLLKKEKIQGIYLGSGKKRYYPKGKMASQVLGFVDANGKGNYGLEEYYDGILKEGANLYLTIDHQVQFEAERILERAKENFEIESGQIVVIDPNSGKILAMASYPNFDPNNYSKEAENMEIFKNKVTQSLFEPGSIFKTITMAAGLNEEKITPETTYFDEGKVQIDSWTIYNYAQRAWGKQTMTNVLERSINTGAIFVEKQLGNELFLKYIGKFGIFEKSGIDLPEIYSENKEFKKGYQINFATASFGQGIEMTPLQLLRAYSAIANGGYLIKPYLVEKIERGGKIVEIKPEISEPILSQKTISQLKAMLLSVVENGFAKRAKIDGYFIAGKTGTSQVSFSSLGIKKKGYSEKTWQTFIGFFPAFEPKILVMVKLDNPKTKTAEYSAVPVFKELVEFLIHYYQIPPDYEVD